MESCFCKGEYDLDSAGFHGSMRRDNDGAADEAATVIAGSGETARLHISVSCEGLANLDRGSLSDPFVVVYMKADCDVSWSEIGRTEVVANNLNPSFVTLVPVTFWFEEVQQLAFRVYDVAGAFQTSDASNLELDQQSSLGSAECALATIMGSSLQSYTTALDAPHLPRQRATITVRAEEAKQSNDMVIFELAVSDIRRKPKRVFVRLSRKTEGGNPLPCYRTAVLNVVNGSCRLQEAEVALLILANGDKHRPLLLECVAYKSSGYHQTLGSCEISVDDMISKAKSGGKVNLSGDAGKLEVIKCALRHRASFVDFLRTGMQMQFTVAIDYTSSNGNPNLWNSLHFCDTSGKTMNQYEQAILTVARVLEHYDSDKRFPVMGFGGSQSRSSPVQHNFAVNRNEADPEVHGVDAILGVYRESLRWVHLGGPTLFAPVINQAASIAAGLRSSNPTQQTYSVLMIMTDGVIHDMDNTKDTLVAAADQPFSVIIVGIGGADFAAMEELDGDDVRIQNSAGKKASRDIVQFVPMRDFAGKGFHALAREVLAEIPAQVVEYMEHNGIKPAGAAAPAYATPF